MPPETLPHSPSSATEDSIDDHDTLDLEAIAADRRQTQKRLFIVAVSLVVLVASVGTIAHAGIFHSGPGSSDSGQNNDASHHAVIARSRIQALCAITDFQDTCVSSIAEQSGLRSGDLNLLVLFSIKAAIAAVQKSYDYSAGLRKGDLDSKAASSFHDCEELLTYALGELNTSYVDLDGLTLRSLPLKMSNILSSLSAAIAFEQTCTDGLPSSGGNPAARMRAMVKNATEETRNSIAIVTGYPSDQLPRGGRILEEANHRPLWYAAGGKPDVVVAQDGSGDYRTIGEALEEAVKERDGRFVIYVKEGVYKENVRVRREMKYVTIYGDGANKTVVTGSKGCGDGVSVYGTATFAVSGKAFMARDIGFKNTAGPEKGQAVALRVESDLSVFYNCAIDGYQSPLLAHAHRQFYRECLISGTIDIVTGDAAAMFQNCRVMVKKPLPSQQNTVAAQTRIDTHETTGIVMQNCTISASPDLDPVTGQVASYLGQPVKEFSLTVVMQSMIEDLIRPEGWALLGGNMAQDGTATAFLGEFENLGPGAKLDGRVTWPAHHALRDAADVWRFTVDGLIMGKWWLDMTGVPFYQGIK